MGFTALKVAIVGSRGFPNLQLVIDYVNSLPEDTEIVSGEARGVDRAAKNAALARGLKYTGFPADWDTYGKSAGFRRNVDVVEYADEIVAFRYNYSPGTSHMIKITLARGKPITIYNERGEVEYLEKSL
jgi:hypothetical protein